MRRGVTFTEIMICTVIVSILSISIFISFSGSTEDAQIAHNLQKLAKLQEQIEQAYAAALQDSYVEWRSESWEFAELPWDKEGTASAADEAVAKPFDTSFSFFPSGTGSKLNEKFELKLYDRLMVVKNAIDYTRAGLCVVRTRLGVKAAAMDPQDSEYAALIASTEPLRVYVDFGSILGGSVFGGSVIAPSQGPFNLVRKVSGGGGVDRISWVGLNSTHENGTIELGNVAAEAKDLFQARWDALEEYVPAPDEEFDAYMAKWQLLANAIAAITVTTNPQGGPSYEQEGYRPTLDDVKGMIAHADWFQTLASH